MSFSEVTNKKNPIFLDLSGKRWLWTKVIGVALICNLILFSILSFNFFQNEFGILSNNVKPLQINAQDRSSNKTFAIIDSSQDNLFAYVRANTDNLSSILCDCLKLEKNNQETSLKIDNNQEITNSLNYLQSNFPSIKRLLYLNTWQEFDGPWDNLPQQAVQLIKENGFDGIVINTDLSDKKEYRDFYYNLSEGLKQNNTEIAFVTKPNLEKVANLRQSTAHIFIDFSIQNIQKSSESQIAEDISNFKTIAKTYPQIKYSLILPTNILSQQDGLDISELTQSDLEKQYNLAYRTHTIDRVTGILTSESDNLLALKKITIFGNIWYFNLQQILKTEKLESVGLDNLVRSQPNALQILKQDDINAKKQILSGSYYITEGVRAQGEGVIFEINENKKPAKLKVDFDESGLVSKFELFENPTSSLVHRTGYQDKHIALTFDDGPDPVFTPRILDILQQYNVKATFFVVGENVMKYPEIAKRIVNEGHTIGNHTYFHSHISVLNDDQIQQEIKLTNQAIKLVTGQDAKFFRTPYNDVGEINLEWDLKNILIAQNMNLTVSEFDTDTNDWSGISAEQILQNLKKGHLRSQILLHDSGGDRTETVKALPLIIQTLEQNGYQITTLNNLAKNQTKQVDISSLGQFSKTGILPIFITNGLFANLLSVLSIFLQISIFLGLLRLFLLIGGLVHKNLFPTKYNKPFLAPVSVIVPCYNEEKVICKTIYSLLNSTYSEMEIIIVDDGSTDNSYKIAQDTFQNDSNVKVYTKNNSGKASSLNFGIAKAGYNFIVCMDADSIFAPDAIDKLMQHFNDPKVGGVAGNVQIGNEYFFMKANDTSIGFWKNFNWLTSCQRQESIFGQNFDKDAYDALKCVIVVPGAIGAWRKEALIQVGGYHTDTLAEDTDLTINILKMGWKIKYEKEALSITEAPETFQQFWKQRFRWQFGTLQVLAKNLSSFFNPKYGTISWFAFPYLLFNIFSLVVAPIVNLGIILLALRFISALTLPGFNLNSSDYKLIIEMGLIIAFYLLVEIASLAFALYHDKSKNKFILLIFLPIQILVYRLIILLVTLKVIIKAFQGRPVGWGQMQRTGRVQYKQIMERESS